MEILYELFSAFSAAIGKAFGQSTADGIKKLGSKRKDEGLSEDSDGFEALSNTSNLDLPDYEIPDDVIDFYL